MGWRSRAGGIRDSGKVGVWVGVGRVGAGGVWRRVVVCAARRAVWVVHGLSVLFSYVLTPSLYTMLSYLIRTPVATTAHPHVASKGAADLRSSGFHRRSRGRQPA